jgi:hypothetical protein
MPDALVIRIKIEIRALLRRMTGHTDFTKLAVPTARFQSWCGNRRGLITGGRMTTGRSMAGFTLHAG